MTFVLSVWITFVMSGGLFFGHYRPPVLTHELDLFGEVVAHQPALNLGGDVVPNRQVNPRIAV